MKGVTEFDKCYDSVFFSMWDFTTGAAGSWRECYRGAKHYGRFLLSELDRKERLEAEGETALARRGLVASDAILKAWLFNVIEDCSQARAPLPPELLEVLYRVLGCRQYDVVEQPNRLIGLRHRFEEMRRFDSDIPVRATARELGVDAATISRWKAEPPSDPNGYNREVYLMIRERTGISKFLENGSKALRR